MNTGNKPPSENDLYAGAEFNELPIGKEFLNPELSEILPDFFFSTEYLPRAVSWSLLATLQNAVERINIEFNKKQIQALQAFRKNHEQRNTFLQNLHKNPNKIMMVCAALACLYEHRNNIKTPPWAQAENAKAFQKEIVRRNRAVIEVFIEIYENALRQFSGQMSPYQEKPIDLSNRPIEFPAQKYPIDPKLAEIMGMTQVQHLAVLGATMQDDQGIRAPNVGRGNSLISAPKDGLEGLTLMDQPEDETDFRNTIRITTHGLRNNGEFMIPGNLAALLFPALKRKFPKDNPMHGLGTSISLVSHVPAIIQPMEEGILIRALSPQEMKRVITQRMPRPDVD